MKELLAPSDNAKLHIVEFKLKFALDEDSSANVELLKSWLRENVIWHDIVTNDNQLILTIHSQKCFLPPQDIHEIIRIIHTLYMHSEEKYAQVSYSGTSYTIQPR